jgi:uncharacterized protein (TIGR00661 family)
MKILYAIQGTGNGHVTRAMEIIPILQKKGEVDILISGTQSDLKLPFEIKYKFNGLSFIFGKGGGVDVWNTYLSMNTLRLLREIKSLSVEEYDLIISDFEPISSWACKLAKKPCIGLSNQVATLHPLAPKPKQIDIIGKKVLEHYAPTTFNYGFHFKSLEHNIFTPIIRKQVRELTITNQGHYTVYLPSYSDEKIIKFLKRFKEIDWKVFSKFSDKSYKESNIDIKPIDNNLFLESMAAATGVLCNAGFGTTSEALFLKKKLMVIPMKTQYEQQCNAAMLKSMGVPVLKKLKKKHEDKMSAWIKDKSIVEVEYPDITEKIIDTIIANHAGKTFDDMVEHSSYPLFQ